MTVNGQLHAPGSFTPGETAYGTHWVSPRAGLDSAREKPAGMEPHLLRRKFSHSGANMVDGIRLSAQVSYVSGLLTYVQTFFRVCKSVHHHTFK